MWGPDGATRLAPLGLAEGAMALQRAERRPAQTGIKADPYGAAARALTPDWAMGLRYAPCPTCCSLIHLQLEVYYLTKVPPEINSGVPSNSDN